MKTRYKIRKEQLERVVESFVMESTEGKMIVKDAAKKHKMNMGAEQHDDMGDGMKKAPVNKKNKMKQAPEVKKNIHGKVSETEIKMFAQINNLTESEVVRRIELLREYDEQAFMKQFNITVKSSYPKLTGKKASDEEVEELYQKAKANDFEGKVEITKKGPEGQLVYVSSKEVTGKTAKLPWWKRVGGSDQTSGK